MSDELKCEVCGTTKDVETTVCPYAQDIHGEEVPAILCKECHHQRCQDI